MENFIKIISIFVFMISFSSFAKTSTNGIDFPKYSKSLTKSNACSCSGAFTSCSAAGKCSCTCGYFTCSCTVEPPVKGIGKIETIDISISKDQFENIENLAKKLHELKAEKSVNYLALMITNIKINDAKSFHKNRENYLNSLSNLDKATKDKLNKFYESVNSTERV